MHEYALSRRPGLHMSKSLRSWSRSSGAELFVIRQGKVTEWCFLGADLSFAPSLDFTTWLDLLYACKFTCKSPTFLHFLVLSCTFLHFPTVSYTFLHFPTLPCPLLLGLVCVPGPDPRPRGYPARLVCGEFVPFCFHLLSDCPL